MILIINTADIQQISIGLVKGEKFLATKQLSAKYRQAEKLLPMIDCLLAERRSDLSKLKAIAVVVGPGPFTALRVGIVTANSLAYALGIPLIPVKMASWQDEKKLMADINSKIKKIKLFKIVKPYYGQEPNITKKVE